MTGRRAGGLALLATAALAATTPGTAHGLTLPSLGLDSTCVLALTKTDPDTVNVAYPDEAAVYWVGAYAALPGMRLRIDGQYPHARYMSFNVYDLAQRPLDALADVEIAPHPGSTNPFREGADRTATRRSYSAFIEFGAKPARPQDRAPNTLYTGTGQNGEPNLVGTFIYRVYTPDAGRDEGGGAGIPTVTLQLRSGLPMSRSLCAELAKPRLPIGLNDQIAASNAEIPIGGAGPAANPPRWRKFVNLLSSVALSTLGTAQPAGVDLDRLGGSGGFFSNIHNAYVAAKVSRDHGQVVVTRMRAPTFPDTRGGTPTMPGGQLRYFSMCQNHTLTQRFIACRADDQSVVDEDGFITYVMSTPEQRPATATAACGATWMPWGPFETGGLIYRHMLPAPDFAQAIQRARVDHERDTMGDYLPESRYYADAAAYDREVGCG